MKNDHNGCDADKKLRKKAAMSATVKKGHDPDNIDTLSEQEIRQKLHELSVHQIELEMQNDELHRIQAELDTARARYFDLYDQAPVGYFTLSNKGLIIEANQTAADILGAGKGELIKQIFSRFIIKEDQDINYQIRKKLFETGQSQECELRMVKKDGTVHWAQIKATLVRNEKGSPVCRLVTCDITDKKFQENERELTSSLIMLANKPGTFSEHMACLTRSLHNWSGCESVSIRLFSGNDVSFYETRGFPPEFVHSENHLCAVDQSIHDRCGNSCKYEHECMCRNILTGRSDPCLPFSSSHGSFWANNLPTLSGHADTDHMLQCRNSCNYEGHSSLAIIPLRINHQIIGLLHLKDHRPGRFNEPLIAHLERMADIVSIGLSRHQTDQALIEKESLYRSTLIENEKKLLLAHEALEERVKNRTYDLTIVNDRLMREIEERQRAEEQLKNSKKLLQSVVDGISDPLILLDTDMRVKVLNKSAARYYGLSEPWNIIGEHCYKAFKGESRMCGGCKISLALLNTTESSFDRQGFMPPHRDEKIYLYPINNKNGQPTAVLYRINDVTKMKIFEKRLIQNEKLASLGVLVSSIAHEINNPNAFISFNIPILREYIEQLISIADTAGANQPQLELFHMPYQKFREDLFELLNNIEHGSERINNFITTLKEFTRIRHNSMDNSIDVSEVAEKAVSICRVKVKTAVKSLTVEIPDHFHRIQSDPIAIEQILINLLINSAQAADKEDSWIKLSITTGGTWLDHTIIEVKDNGCGIPRENLDHVFDPFFSTKSSSEGTGLGLYVCHGLVTGLGGRIEVESKVGEFSIFRIIFPDIERRKKKRPAPAFSLY